MKDIFYVYEHWRPDTDMPFWVGKGKNRRAKSHIGIADTPETKAAKSEAQRIRHKATPPSAETKAKIGAKHKGNTYALGCVRSPETRARMSAAQKARFAASREIVEA